MFVMLFSFKIMEEEFIDVVLGFIAHNIDGSSYKNNDASECSTSSKS